MLLFIFLVCILLLAVCAFAGSRELREKVVFSPILFPIVRPFLRKAKAHAFQKNFPVLPPDETPLFDFSEDNMPLREPDRRIWDDFYALRRK